MCLALMLGTVLAVTDRAFFQARPIEAGTFSQAAATDSLDDNRPSAIIPNTQSSALSTIIAASSTAFQLPNIKPLPLTSSQRAASPPDLSRFQPKATFDRSANQPNQAALPKPAMPLLAFLPKPLRRPNVTIERPRFVTWSDPRLPSSSSAPSSAPPQPLQTLTQEQSVADLNQSGYDALALGDDTQAMRAFQDSLKIEPDQPLILAQLGYLYKARGLYAAAAASFSNIVPSAGLQPGIAREESYLSRSMRLNAYTVWRQGSRPEADISFGPSLAQSQSGVAATYRLPIDGWASRHDLAVYSRVLWGYEPSSLTLNSQSLQGGLGVQLRPFADLNLVTAAERLISIGDQSRDDWLLRTSYSDGGGYAPINAERSWVHWSVYADAAVIDPADPDIQLIGESRIGFGQRPFETSSFTIIPFAGAFANYQDAGGQTTSLLEAGAGVWMRYWPGGSNIPDPIRALDVRLEYRGKVGGDSASTSGVRVTLDMTY